MKETLFVAGAYALTLAGIALANPGNGHGKGHEFGPGASGSPYGVNGPVGYGVHGCPPGLAKKQNGCLPPGQARKLLRGQRFPDGFGTRYGYRQIPDDLRHRYDLDPYDRYYYNEGYLYRVDPKTMLVEQVMTAILHR